MAGGSGGGPSAFPKLFAQRTRMNHEAMTYYATALAAIMGVFIVFHLTRLIAQKTGLASRLSFAAKPFVFVSRIIRRVSVRKVPFLPSTGHAVITTIYVVANIVLCLTYIDTSTLSYLSVVGARAGWLSIVNIAFLVFLSLKNTPLGYLTAWSYERLNVLHQIAGYVTMALIIVHGVTYSSYFIGHGNIARLRVHEEVYGIVSGFTFLVLVLAGAIVRLWYYELFYILHVSGFAISMVLVGLHQPELSKKIVYITAAAAGIWLLDRAIRLVRVVAYSFNNTATVHPLPNGGTRITLKKAPYGASSGEHCFLWIPKIRALEMHPFTIAAMDPLEFVINSYDGFTRDLHEYAVRHPGATIKASVEGSYGTFPNPAEYDKVILVAGGSGASFTVGTALNMLKRLTRSSGQSIVFIWMVKEHSRLEWFAHHLSTINDALSSSVLLYVTRPISSSESYVTTEDRSRSATISSQESSPITPDSEKFDVENSTPRQPPKVVTRAISDSEKSGSESDSPLPGSPMQKNGAPTHINTIPINYGRADVSAIIRTTINDATPNQRVLVMGCGPESLMTQVRNTTASCIRTSGPAVELHCEQFGW
ncbi:ferric reductase like transmembrane component [Colletotrichum graminicola]|uniref:Ferric reductase like transmembrane component n=1 Tax=Colletotrichum graminicola (strain M1.001 / M2 / FGSC 10212) TaxID=645133 RepID=E3QBJ7_COLGM|nr:ferric reductase like transmembrane component [Colletotrichum graminicola M1.001]EFQ28336.1 ferric reductase like transmembrane component [Colletotrichum graminicola M1.001]WDK20696.1 ferric reductase like transmembrane component [Colletotrichum graminicola]